MKTFVKVQTKRIFTSKHRCYYGFAKTPWNHIICQHCGKIIKSRLLLMFLLTVGLFAAIALVLYIN